MDKIVENVFHKGNACRNCTSWTRKIGCIKSVLWNCTKNELDILHEIQHFPVDRMVQMWYNYHRSKADDSQKTEIPCVMMLRTDMGWQNRIARCQSHFHMQFLNFAVISLFLIALLKPCLSFWGQARFRFLEKPCRKIWWCILRISFVPRKSIFMIASPERGDSPRGGEMPAGQRGPLSTRGTAVRRWRGFS